MHADPVAHAAQHFDAVDAYHAQLEKEEDRIRSEFIQSVTTKTLTDRAGFGHVYVGSKRVPASVIDVLCNAMDSGKGNDAAVFGALILCAKKGDVDAIAAIKKLADTYASSHAEVDV